MLVRNEPLESRTPRLWTASVTVAALVVVAVVAAVSISPRAVAGEKPVKPGKSTGASGILPVSELSTGETPVPPAAPAKPVEIALPEGKSITANRVEITLPGGNSLTLFNGQAAIADKQDAATPDDNSTQTYRIQPLDLLTIEAIGTAADQPIDGTYLVEPSGKVALGPAYGRVEIKGLTMDQAEVAIRKQLKQILTNPEVQVTAAGRATHWPAGKSPQTPLRISPNDSLQIWVAGTLVDQPIHGTYVVEPSGKVALGPAYGRVEVKGLTLEDAEQAIVRHLQEILKNPEVSVTLPIPKSDAQLQAEWEARLEARISKLERELKDVKTGSNAVQKMRKELEELRKEIKKAGTSGQPRNRASGDAPSP